MGNDIYQILTFFKISNFPRLAPNFTLFTAKAEVSASYGNVGGSFGTIFGAHASATYGASSLNFARATCVPVDLCKQEEYLEKKRSARRRTGTGCATNAVGTFATGRKVLKF